MADVHLNLVYDDNGAYSQIQRIAQMIQSIENRRFDIRFNVDQASIRRLDKINILIRQINNLTVSRFGKFGNLAALTGAADNAERKMQSLAVRAVELQRALKDTAPNTTDYLKLLGELNNVEREYNKAAAAVDDFNSAISEIENSAPMQELENQIKLEGNRQKNAEKRMSAYEKMKADAQAIADAMKKAEQSTNGVERAGRSLQDVFKGISSATMNLAMVMSYATSAISSFKSLPGISQVSSFMDSFVTSPISGLFSTITTGIGGGVERFDIMNTFPQILQGMGYSADAASRSVNALRESVLGLPVSLAETVDTAQYLTLLSGDLEHSTDLTIALNNAFVASGASTQQMSDGLRQVTYLMEGTDLYARQWFSLIRSMPVAIREVGEALGYADLPSFTADLRTGAIDTNVFLDTLIDVAGSGGALDRFLDVFKTKLEAALKNLEIAGNRFGESLLNSLNGAFEDRGGVAGVIQQLSSFVDSMATVGSTWIENNADRILSIIDRFFAYDWGSVLTGALEGLLDTLEIALDTLESTGSIFGENFIGYISTFSDSISSIAQSLQSILYLIGGVAGLVGGFALFKGLTFAGIGTALTGIGSSLLSMNPVLAGLLAAVPVLIVALNDLSSTIVSSRVFENEYEEGYEKFRGQFEGVSETRRQALSRGSVSQFTASVDNEIGLLREREKALNDFVSRANKASTAFSPDYTTVGTPTFEADLAQTTAFDLVISNAEKELSDVSTRLNNLTQSYYATIYESFSQLDLGPFASTINESYLEALDSIYEASAQGLEMNDEMTTLIGDFNKKLEEGKEAVEQAQNEVTEAQNRVNALQKSLEELDEKIQKIKQDVKLTGDFQKLYENGGFLSRQLAASAGTFEGTGLYRNTAEDYLGQAEKYQGVVEDIVEQFNTLSPEDQAKYRDVFFEQLTEIYSDPTQWGKLETIGNDMSKMGVEAFLAGYTGTQMNINEVEAGTQSVINSLVEESLNRDLEEAERNLEEKKGTVEELVSSYSTDLTSLLSAVSGFWEAAADTVFSTIGSKFARASSEELIKVKNIVDDFNRMLANVLSNVGNVDVVGQTPRVTFQNPRYSAPEGASPMATGGGVFAPMGTDTVPAMLTPGEYVHRRAVVNYYGKAFMDRLNNLDLRGALASLSMNYATPYSTGGIVNSDNRSYRDNHASVVQNFNNSRSDYSLRRANRYLRGFA